MYKERFFYFENLHIMNHEYVYNKNGVYSKGIIKVIVAFEHKQKRG